MDDVGTDAVQEVLRVRDKHKDSLEPGKSNKVDLYTREK